MAGKYAHLIAKLPRLLGTEPAYQEKVDVVKQGIKLEEGTDNIHASRLAQMYEGLRGSEDPLLVQSRSDKEEIEALISKYGKCGIEAILSEVNLRLEAVSQMMVDQFEVESVTSLRLASGRSVGVQYEPYAQVKDKEAFRVWCINNGLEKSMSLPWMTTNSITKERLLNGDPEPDGVEAHVKTKIVLRKA